MGYETKFCAVTRRVGLRLGCTVPYFGSPIIYQDTRLSSNAFLTTSMKHLSALALGAALLAGPALQAQTTLTEAVDFTVTDTHGETHNMQDILDGGQYMLIDFFAYWCGPCAALTPDLSDIYTDFGCNTGDVFVLSIEVDGNDAQTIAFEEDNGGLAPAASGTEGGGAAVHGTYGVSAYPTFILVDPTGDIVEQDIWPADYTILKNKLESYGIIQKACATTGVQTLSLDLNLTLAPNPATAYAVLSWTQEGAMELEAELIDQSGRVVRTVARQAFAAGAQQLTLETEGLAPGTYIAVLRDAEGAQRSLPLAVQ